MKEVLKATTKTGSGSALSMLLTAVASKIMAMILGPYGVGVYSVLVQLNQTASTAGTIGGETALVQGLSSRKDSEQTQYASTVFWIFIIGAGTMSIAMALLADWIAPIALGEEVDSAASLVRMLAVPVALLVIYIYVRGVLNGFRAIGRLAVTQVVVAGANALLAYPVSTLVGSGYMLAFIVMLSASYFAGIVVGVYFARKEGWIRLLGGRRPTRLIDRDAARHFASIATITLITGLIATGTLLAVRAGIVGAFGMDEAGIFNAAWTIGMTYAMVVLASFGTYYLPTLARTSNGESRCILMNQVLWVATLIMVPLTTGAVVLKPLVVDVLFSKDFLPALDMIRWMLIAAYLKSFSWILAMPMLAYADMRTYFIAESLWYIGFLTFSIVSVVGFGSIEGIGIGFLCLYTGYLGYTWRYSRTRWGFKPQRKLLGSWLIGLALVVGASWQTWHQTAIDPISTGIWMFAVGMFLAMFFEKGDRRRALDALAGRIRRRQ